MSLTNSLNTADKVKLLAKEHKYNLSEPSFTPKRYPDEKCFSFEKVNSKQVQRIIEHMPSNKAPGIDKIPIRVIKDCLPAILQTITSFINSSFVSTTFPSIWKTAEVIPIPKEGDHELANNTASFVKGLWKGGAQSATILLSLQESIEH